MSDEKLKADPEHLAWAITQRAEVQRSLLGLYEFFSNRTPESIQTVRTSTSSIT